MDSQNRPAAHGDFSTLRAAATAAWPSQIDDGWYDADSLALDSVDTPDVEFIAAAAPDRILALLAERDRYREALESAERALADAERIVTKDGLVAWVGTLNLERVRAALEGASVA